jgi:hypothetical protein
MTDLGRDVLLDGSPHRRPLRRRLSQLEGRFGSKGEELALSIMSPLCSWKADVGADIRQLRLRADFVAKVVLHW